MSDLGIFTPTFFGNPPICYLFEKYVIAPDGSMVVSDMPVELLLGWEWRELRFKGRMMVAYSYHAGREEYNRYWEAVRDTRVHPRLRGTIVVWMPYAHIEPRWVYPSWKLRKPLKACVLQ